MLADIKGPHLDFLGGDQQPFTRLWQRCSDFAVKCIGAFVVYLNITERSNQLVLLARN